MPSDTAPLHPFNHNGLLYTQSPNTSFAVGQEVGATPEGKAWVDGEKEGWKGIDVKEIPPAKLGQLMTSAIIPRPVGFVSTVSEDGVENLALFSWFNIVTNKPPLLSLCLRSFEVEGVELKDTTRNILTTKQFTVGIISQPFVENANFCSIETPPEISEWPLSGLTKAPCVHVKPPRVKECAFSMECELYSSTPILHPDTGIITTTMILGLVKYVHVRNDVLNDRGNVDPTKLKPICRLGDIQYASLGQSFRIPRPIWKKEEEEGCRKFLADLQVEAARSKN